MNESVARGEPRQEGSRSVFRLRLKVSMVGDVRIASGIEFQMTGVLNGVGTRKCWSEERRERTD